MSRKRRAPERAPHAVLLSATDAAELLGVGRTRFWQLRKQFDLQRVPLSSETRPLYRREDVLRLARPQGAQTEPAVEPQPQPVLTEEEVRYKAAFGEPAKPFDPSQPFEWPKGSDELPEWADVKS